MVHDFENIKVNFLNDVFAIVKMEDIPDELILNWDHTPIKLYCTRFILNHGPERSITI